MKDKKNNQRVYIKELKRNRSKEDNEACSLQIFRQIELMPEFIEAKTVLAYWSMNDEVYTHSFIFKWFRRKRILLPVVRGDDLELGHFTGMEDLKKGHSFGIMEPFNAPIVSVGEVDLAIVPGVAFDISGNRLGRGKGYYDKLLLNRKMYKIGVCFSFQLLQQVITEKYDIKMDRVIHA